MNLVLSDTIRIPIEFDSLETFRVWSKSGRYPERGDYFYLDGDLWVDLLMETLLHNQIKSIFNIVLGGMLLRHRIGLYCGDRMRLVNVDANFSCDPDGMFVSHAARRAGRVMWEEGADSLEVIGTPDMVLEVVSSSSIQKDSATIRELYWRAGIREYWLVNPLGGQLAFDILRRTDDGYTAVARTGGWLKSGIFRPSFRLLPQKIGQELPQFRLLVRN